jgi:hypothetical protein
MKRKTKKIVLALVVIGVVAAGGAAFTAANTVPSSVAGYGANTVTGATLNFVHHNLSADGTHILTTDLQLDGDHHTDIIKAGFGVAGSPEAQTLCVTGAYDNVGDTTAAVCTWNPGGTPPGHVTDTNADLFGVAVTSVTP